MKQKTKIKVIKLFGKGGFGTVRFALSLLRGRSLSAEIVCIQKTKSFEDLSDSSKPTPLEQVTELTFRDILLYNGRTQVIYSPFILNITLVTNKKVINYDEKIIAKAM